MSDAASRVRAAFHSQGKSCAMLGSPFMGRLMPLIGERLTADTEVGARILGWEGDVSPAGQSVPLRTAGALHRLVLENRDPALVAAYPPSDVDDDTLWSAVEAAFRTRGAVILRELDRAPQTNEVRRSSVLLPTLWSLSGIVGALPIELSELGASAGLNLMLDRFSIETPQGLVGPPESPVRLRPEWRGAPPPAVPLTIAGRAGVDRHPIDARDPADALRLMSYIWPDQSDRMALTRGAIDLGPVRPDEDDAAPWLATRLSGRAEGCLHVVYTTIAWQYFPAETQASCTRSLEEAGARADTGSPLAHVAFEADGQREGAALTVRLWPHAPEPRVLARADFHGRWVDWLG
jgi:hypothetical protein